MSDIDVIAGMMLIIGYAASVSIVLGRILSDERRTINDRLISASFGAIWTTVVYWIVIHFGHVFTENLIFNV